MDLSPHLFNVAGANNKFAKDSSRIFHFCVIPEQ